MKTINATKTTLAAVAALSVAGFALPSSAADVVDTLRAGGYATMADLVERSGLVYQLREKGPFTVLAPTDEAIEEALAAEGAPDLTAPENAATLFRVLQYHVFPGEYTSEEIVDWDMMHTLHGNAVGVFSMDGVQFNDAAVVEADVEADNGLIHGIDAVLMPTALMP